MDFRDINRFFPFKKLFWLLLVMVTIIQLAVITYNHLSGYHILENTVYFIVRLLRGVGLSLIASFLLAYPDLFFIRFLNQSFPWNKKVFARVTLEFPFAVFLGFAVSILFTSVAHWISQYKEDLFSVYVSNALIFGVVNLILIIILEAWLFFTENSRTKQKAEDLEKELSQIRFEVLKNQINPHFMFNSLNVLSGLIDSDSSKAQEFIDEFSVIYRYVLETIEKPVVTLKEELGFVRSYFFLQEMRYSSALRLNVDIPAEMLTWFLPPLSLQVVLENAIKHNTMNESSPLQIDIYSSDDLLMVRNNIQPKVSSVQSTRLGQNNMIKRYAMIGDKTPQFRVKTNHYIVEMPLLKPEEK
jgi:hypothetical protein